MTYTSNSLGHCDDGSAERVAKSPRFVRAIEETSFYFPSTNNTTLTPMPARAKLSQDRLVEQLPHFCNSDLY
ncbi:Small ribosomal subunit protein bS16c [Trichinella spiralis]|uniref:Small ribosomal subunit protein bS16c n=1 Tax=Trichinella spiralis TaxID=6334 RepID=A0ABR3K5P6_TRISP